VLNTKRLNEFSNKYEFIRDFDGFIEKRGGVVKLVLLPKYDFNYRDIIIFLIRSKYDNVVFSHIYVFFKFFLKYVSSSKKLLYTFFLCLGEAMDIIN
jgi:hypothetical protein